MAGETTRYGIDDLAQLGGVSRRTVRYYVQQGLLQPPLGVGRGRHYAGEHLERLLQVKSLQEQGRSLDEIRRIIAGGEHAAQPFPAVVSRSLWRRLVVQPGIEIHVNSEVRLPPPGRLQELADWCRANFGAGESEEEHE
ncbi:MAG: MerR family transcriptional regulator [Vicinamibacterales bacterium]